MLVVGSEGLDQPVDGVPLLAPRPPAPPRPDRVLPLLPRSLRGEIVALPRPVVEEVDRPLTAERLGAIEGLDLLGEAEAEPGIPLLLRVFLPPDRKSVV